MFFHIYNIQLVQVKHHSGYTNDWGLQQLNLIQEEDERYSDYDLILLTSAKVEKETKQIGEKINVLILDEEELDLLHYALEIKRDEDLFTYLKTFGKNPIK